MKQLCTAVAAPSWVQSADGVFSYLDRVHTWGARMAETFDTTNNATLVSLPVSTTTVVSLHQVAALQGNPASADFIISDLMTSPVSDGPAGDYLRMSARWLQQNKAAYIKITSYTQDEAMRYDNLLIGLDLADDIKQYLVSLGADANTIHVSSMKSLKSENRYQTIMISPSSSPSLAGE